MSDICLGSVPLNATTILSLSEKMWDCAPSFSRNLYVLNPILDNSLLARVPSWYARAETSAKK